jgi:hypothetical protein
VESDANGIACKFYDITFEYYGSFWFIKLAA